MLSEFTDRQAANADLYELEDVETGQKRQYRIVSKATVTVPGTDLNKATLDPILEEIARKLSANGGTMSGNFSGPGPSGISRIGYPEQIGEVYALQAYLNGIEMRGNMLPDSNNVRNVGSASKRMAYVYGVNGNFSTQVAINGYSVVGSGDGASDTGRYVKMYDGTMICYHSKTVSVDITRPYDALYFGYGPAWTYPQTFTAAPVVMVTLDDNNLISAVASGADASKILGTYIYGTKSITSYSLKIRFVAIGRWK